MSLKYYCAFVLQFCTLILRNNADLGKGVPRLHVNHESWELLFFRILTRARSVSNPFSPPPIKVENTPGAAMPFLVCFGAWMVFTCLRTT